MQLEKGLIAGEEGQIRCWWPGADPFYQAYHDNEWGQPVSADFRLFEKICLEGFQSGLSWITILRKRENFRAAFAGFDFHKVAMFNDDDIERLLADSGIVRHRGKIVSTINNAARAIEMKQEFGALAAYFWSFEPPKTERPAKFDHATLMAQPTTAASVAPVQRPEKARLVLRRPDHLLRLHAGDGAGERSSGGLPLPRAAGEAESGICPGQNDDGNLCASIKAPRCCSSGRCAF